MNKKRIRERRKSKSPKKRITNLLIWGGVGIAVIVVVVLSILGSNPTAQAAASIQEMNQVAQIPIASRNHIPIGSPLPAYNSDPPAGGDHYPATMPTKFYKESGDEQPKTWLPIP